MIEELLRQKEKIQTQIKELEARLKEIDKEMSAFFEGNQVDNYYEDDKVIITKEIKLTKKTDAYSVISSKPARELLLSSLENVPVSISVKFLKVLKENGLDVADFTNYVEKEDIKYILKDEVKNG